MNKKLIRSFRLAIGIIVFGIGIALLIGDNPYAETYKWYEHICYGFNTVCFIAFGFYLLDLQE